MVGNCVVIPSIKPLCPETQCDKKNNTKKYEGGGGGGGGGRVGLLLGCRS